MFSFVLLRILFAMGVFGFSNAYVSESVSTAIIQILVMGAIPLVGYFLLQKRGKTGKEGFKQTLNDFGFKKVSFKTIILAILLGVCVYIFNIFVASFFDSLISSLGYESAGGSSGGVQYNSIPSLIFGLVSVAVFPGIFEEIAHRGLLLGAGKKAIGAKGAILLSGLCFGLMHLNINQFFYATLIGIFIAFVAYISNSIFPAMIIHFVNNAINVYFSYASNTGSVGSDWFNNINKFLSSSNTLVVLISVIGCVFVLACVTVLLVLFLFNDNNKERSFKFRLLTKESVIAYQSNPKVVKQISAKLKETENLIKTENKEIVARTEDVIIPQDADISKTLFPENPPKLKFEFKDGIFFFAVLILGGLTTLATFIWGVL